jgi:hypothetical protein
LAWIHLVRSDDEYLSPIGTVIIPPDDLDDSTRGTHPQTLGVRAIDRVYAPNEVLSVSPRLFNVIGRKAVVIDLLEIEINPEKVFHDGGSPLSPHAQLEKD